MSVVPGMRYSGPHATGSTHCLRPWPCSVLLCSSYHLLTYSVICLLSMFPTRMQTSWRKGLLLLSLTSLAFLSSGIFFTHQCMVHPFSVCHLLTTPITFYPIALLFFSSHWLTQLYYFFICCMFNRPWAPEGMDFACLLYSSASVPRTISGKKKKKRREWINDEWMNE